nr:MAG TPA: hypothetical protein [Caudoviricetes sp.]
MKIYRTILVILTVIFLYEGFQGEFSAPSLFDWVKWGAWFFLTAVYFYQRRRAS